MNSNFAALIARPVDRLEIAGRATFGTTAQRIEAQVPLAPLAAMVVGFFPADGMTWDELRTILRYVPDEYVTYQAEQLAQAGLISIDGDLRYTDAGRQAAQSVLDSRPDALAELWDSLATVSALTELLRTSANTASQSLSATIIGRSLAPSEPHPQHELWQLLSVIRRCRADDHAAAWSSVGLNTVTVAALAAGPERDAVEADTNRRNSTVWSHLNEAQQIEVLAGLASLNGTGNPS